MKKKYLLPFLPLCLLVSNSQILLNAKDVKEGSTICIEALATKTSKAYFEAFYKKDYLKLNINVIDDIIFVSNDILRSDGVSFILASSNSDTILKIIASMDNKLEVYKKDGDDFSLIDSSSISFNAKKANISQNRFKGYILEIKIPYKELLDLTYAHPTFAEIITDTLLNLNDKAINLLKQ